MPTDPHQPSGIERAIEFVKRSRSRYVSKNEILDMLMVNAQLRKEEFVDKGTTTTKPQASPDMFLRTRLPLTTK
ncbi:hypothetical protein H257_02259 [Aphanomyces astaci]|uniref:Uncharacterized protein n=1 Tax=Aphanomyces astaci TaxID=112090 RepID=W4H239_APHAT|nr:hypothetical protein H257_02259 [Aphanomyces astaci]ETV85641.1 hypothetical protein H257_02259 [Aphanomyces astaci]|eukprot:XP_009824113.1 hypothetical protein H257_02259 [Aphanomyces astaci]